MSNQWNSHEKRIASLERWIARHGADHVDLIESEKDTAVTPTFPNTVIFNPPDDPMPQGEWIDPKGLHHINDLNFREYAVQWLELKGVGRRIAPLELWMELGKELGIATEPRLLIRAPVDNDA